MNATSILSVIIMIVGAFNLVHPLFVAIDVIERPRKRKRVKRERNGVV